MTKEFLYLWYIRRWWNFYQRVRDLGGSCWLNSKISECLLCPHERELNRRVTIPVWRATELLLLLLLLLLAVLCYRWLSVAYEYGFEPRDSRATLTAYACNVSHAVIPGLRIWICNEGTTTSPLRKRRGNLPRIRRRIGTNPSGCHTVWYNTPYNAAVTQCKRTNGIPVCSVAIFYQRNFKFVDVIPFFYYSF